MTTNRRASDVSIVPPTQPFVFTKAGMSSLIAPLRHGHARFEDAARQNEANSSYHEDIAISIEDRRARNFGLPGLAMIAKRIRRGQILVPMSKFLDAAIPEIMGTRNTNDMRLDRTSIDAMLQTLSTTAINADKKLSLVTQRTNRERIWKPAQLPSGADTSRMSVKHLCVYALATVYDIASQLNISPSQDSMAATIRALASCGVDVQTFVQCTMLVLLQLSGFAFHEAQQLAADENMQFRRLDAKRIDAVVVSATIDGFGILGKPELGELLLSWWSNSRSDGAQGVVRTSLPPDDVRLSGTTIDAACWYNDIAIWKALFCARGRNDDLVGARHWLQEYRQLVPQAMKVDSLYYEYANACMALDKEQSHTLEYLIDHSAGDTPLKVSILRDILRMIVADGLRLSEEVLSLYVNTLVRLGRPGEAALTLHRAFDSDISPAWSSGLCKAVFRLHRMNSIQGADECGAFADAFAEYGFPKPEVIQRYGPYHAFRPFVSQSVPKIQQAAVRMQRKVSPALEEALQSCVAQGDLPLAMLVLDYMQCGSLELNYHTVDSVQRWLHNCHDGHTPLRDRKEPRNTFSDLQRRTRSALRISHSRLPKTSPFIQHEREDDTGFSITRRAIYIRLIESVRQCLTYNPAVRIRSCSDWMVRILDQLDGRRTDMIDDEEIIQIAISQISTQVNG